MDAVDPDDLNRISQSNTNHATGVDAATGSVMCTVNVLAAGSIVTKCTAAAFPGFPCAKACTFAEPTTRNVGVTVSSEAPAGSVTTPVVLNRTRPFAWSARPSRLRANTPRPPGRSATPNTPTWSGLAIGSYSSNAVLLAQHAGLTVLRPPLNRRLRFRDVPTLDGDVELTVPSYTDPAVAATLDADTVGAVARHGRAPGVDAVTRHAHAEHRFAVDTVGISGEPVHAGSLHADPFEADRARAGSPGANGGGRTCRFDDPGRRRCLVPTAEPHRIAVRGGRGRDRATCEPRPEPCQHRDDHRPPAGRQVVSVHPSHLLSTMVRCGPSPSFAQWLPTANTEDEPHGDVEQLVPRRLVRAGHADPAAPVPPLDEREGSDVGRRSTCSRRRTRDPVT